MPDNEPTLTRTELAAALGRSPSYVYAMKKAGYEFAYRLTTTLAHARQWLTEHPDFTCTGYFYPKGRSKKPETVGAAN